MELEKQQPPIPYSRQYLIVLSYLIMSEQEKIILRNRILEGLKKSFHDLVVRKAALGQEMVVGDSNGATKIRPAAELLSEIEKDK